MWTLLQAVTAPVHLVSAQDAVGATALGAAWATSSTAIHLGFGQAIKQMPFVRNKWLDIILPVMGILGGVGLPFLIHFMGYGLDPLGLVALFGGHVTGSVTSKGAYIQSQPANADTGKAAGVLASVPILGQILQTIASPGPTNAPGDIAAAAQAPPPPPPPPPPPGASPPGAPTLPPPPPPPH